MLLNLGEGLSAAVAGIFSGLHVIQKTELLCQGHGDKSLQEFHSLLPLIVYQLLYSHLHNFPLTLKHTLIYTQQNISTDSAILTL